MTEPCHFIIGFKMEPGEDGDPIFCDKMGSIKYDGAWFCAEHYDEIMASPLPESHLPWDDESICKICNCEFYNGECNCEFYGTNV